MKKNIILLIILFIIGGIYFSMNYIGEKNRQKQNIIKSLDFNKFSFNHIKTNKLDIKNNNVVYYGTGEYITDKEKVRNFIDNIKNIKVKYIVSNNKDNFNNFGISSSGSYVNIDNIKILLGKNRGYTGEEYIKLATGNKIYLIDKNLKQILNKNSEFFKKEKKENIVKGTGSIKGK